MVFELTMLAADYSIPSTLPMSTYYTHQALELPAVVIKLGNPGGYTRW